MCEDVNPFWDQILDLVDERKKTYDPDDRMYLENVKIHFLTPARTSINHALINFLRLFSTYFSPSMLAGYNDARSSRWNFYLL